MAKPVVYRVVAPDGQVIEFTGDPGAPESAQQAYAASLWKPKASYRVGQTSQEVTGAIVEPLMRVITGAVAKPLGDLAGLSIAARGAITGETDLDPEGARTMIMEGLTYQPRTRAGASNYNPINAAVNALGSGISYLGDVGSGLVSDDPNSSLGRGTKETVEQGLGFALPLVTKPVVKGVGKAVDLAQRKTPTMQARNIVKATLGDTAPAVAEKFRTAPSTVTAGQAAYGTAPAQFQTLARQARGYSATAPDRYMSIDAAQEAARKAKLGRMAGGQSEAASIAARETASKNLTNRLDKYRTQGADAANANTRRIVQLENEAAAARKAAEQSAATARKLDPLTERPIPNESTIAMRQRLRQLRWKARDLLEKSADESVSQGAKARAAEGELGEMSAQGISKLSAQPLLDAIDQQLSKVGDRTNPVQQTTLRGLREHVSKYVDQNGNIDAYDLHGIRKNLNDITNSLLKDTDNATRARAGAVASSLKPVMDEGLSAAGGKALIEYFDKFAKGRKQISRMQLASDASRMTPEQLIALAEGNNVAAVQNVFPRGYDLTAEMGKTSANRIKGIASEYSRDIGMAKQAEAGAVPFNATLSSATRLRRLPNVPFSPTATTNAVIRELESALSTKTKAVLAQALENPQNALKLLETLPAGERFTALRILQNYNIMAPAASAVNSSGMMLPPQEPE